MKSPYVKLAEIFNKLNSSMCSDCPAACAETQKDLEGQKEIWNFRTKEMGCCTFCAQKKGHLGHNAGDPKFEDLKWYFDSEYGFFDNKRKTCRLPREKRSLCCLRYTCSAMSQKLNIVLLNRVHKICDQIQEERLTK